MGHTDVVITLRFATAADSVTLLELDFLTMSPTTSPGQPRTEPQPGSFFNEHSSTQDVIVAEQSGRLVGYVHLEKPTPLASNRHVLMVGGFSVDPEHQRSGIGGLLIDAAVHESELRGARKLSLRVLSTNEGALGLYEKRGFVVEGVLRDEFFLNGRYVDDIMMTRSLVHLGKGDAHARALP